MFVIKDCATNQVVFKIPRGLFGFKMTDTNRFSISTLAKHLMFIREDKIRIINKYGLDTSLKLNIEDGSVSIESICKIDHWDTSNKDDRHKILD